MNTGIASAGAAMAGSIAAFMPSARSAIFINAKDLDVERYNRPDSPIQGHYHPLVMIPRGNRAMYEFEAALTGQVTLPKEIVDEHGIKALEPYLETIRYATKGVAEEAAQYRSEELKRTMLYRIHPFMDMRAALVDAIGKIARAADDAHLTSIYLYARGDEEGFEIAMNEVMLYAGLLDLLDSIPGRKAIIACTGLSGKFLDILREHTASHNYSAITSTSGEAGMNWNDDVFNERIIDVISRGALMSEVSLSEIGEGTEPQKPDSLLNFDTVI